MSDPNEDPSGVTPDRRIKLLEVGHRVLIDQIADLAVAQKDMTDQIEKAVQTGMEKALSSMFDRLQQQAAEKTGRWAWSVVKSLVSRWLVIGFIVVMVGKAAGFQAAVTVFDWFRGKP